MLEARPAYPPRVNPTMRQAAISVALLSLVSGMTLLAVACGTDGRTLPDASAPDGSMPDTSAIDAASGDAGAPDFALALASPSVAVVRGATDEVGVRITRIGGFTDAVDVAVDGLPAGVTASALSIPAGSDIGTLALRADATAALGTTSTSSVRASGGGHERTVSLAVLVSGPHGELDATFGAGGRLVDTFNVFSDTAFDVVVDVLVRPGGEIVVTGTVDPGAGAYLWGLAQYTSSGTLDSRFGFEGRYTTFPRDGRVAGSAVQPDGAILLVGSQASTTVSGTSVALLRFLPDGTPDPSFGTGGAVETASNGQVAGAAVAVQSDGRIVVAATHSSPEGGTVLFRYQRDGTIDASFGIGGQAGPFAHAGRFGVSAIALAFDPDGRIVVLEGQDVDVPMSAQSILEVLSPDGRPDATFGAGGLATTDGTLAPSGLAIDPTDGSILVSGWTGSSLPFVVERWTRDGLLVTGFGSSGSASPSFPWALTARIARQADGRLVVAGGAWVVAGLNFGVLRLEPSGALDASFGSSGLANTAIGMQSHARAIAIQPDGRIVVAGRSDDDFAVARYWP